MKQYIYPIIRGEKQVGHGFLANDYFITAVHILRENDNAYVIIDGEKVEFDSIGESVPSYHLNRYHHSAPIGTKKM